MILFFLERNSNIDFENKFNQAISEIPSYAKEVIKESIFYESKNLINNQF